MSEEQMFSSLKYSSVSAMTSFLSPIKPMRLGIAIQPLTISARIKINFNDMNGPIAIRIIKMIL